MCSYYYTLDGCGIICIISYSYYILFWECSYQARSNHLSLRAQEKNLVLEQGSKRVTRNRTRDNTEG